MAQGASKRRREKRRREKPGGIGGQPNLTTGDVKLIERAIVGGWEMPPEARTKLPMIAFRNALLAFESGDLAAAEKLSALLARFDALNQAAMELGTKLEKHEWDRKNREKEENRLAAGQQLSPDETLRRIENAIASKIEAAKQDGTYRPEMLEMLATVQRRRLALKAEG